MRILSTNERENLEQKSNIDKYYLLAMLAMSVILMGIAYYDQIVSRLVR